MSDNLEKFIRQNRRDFDQDQPGADVWSDIEKTLPIHKRENRFTLRDIYKWSAAAAAVVILLSSLYFLVIRKNSHERADDKLPVTVNPVEYNNMSPEYAAEFKEVYQSIGEKQKELQTVTADQPGLYEQFRQDLLALDSSYEALKLQSENSPNRDVLIRAMIQNRRLQVELLTRQLMISNQLNNNSKKSTDESSI